MTKAFIVNLDTGSDTDFVTLAEEIQDELTKVGMQVISVQPWASPEPKVAVGLPPQQSIQAPPAPPTPPSII